MMSYDPPAGRAGKMIAKLLHRGPCIQVKEDLARLSNVLESRSPE
jgi:uncharacterized membrane protein